MSDAPACREDLAHRLAATGVAAFAYGVGVEQLSLPATGNQVAVAKLAPIAADVLATKELSDEHRVTVEDYVTVLMADSVGRLIWQEKNTQGRLRAVSATTLRRRRMAEALRAATPDTDRAYALVVAGLSPLHYVHARSRIEEMWRRANRLLRMSPHAERYASLAKRLLDGGRMSGAEIADFLAQMND